jgi:tetratricopeptide (TPR) repeat protein
VKGRAYVDPAASERAAGLFRDALALDFVKNRPDRAATVQNELGKALSDSGQRRASEPLLLEAVAAFQAALEIYAPATDLQNWGTITGNIGTVYMRLGERTRDTARLLQARALFESVLAYKRAELGADVWLNAQTNLATTLQRIAERERNAAIFAQADAAFEIALNARKDGGPTATLAMIYLNRGGTLLNWHQLVGDRKLLDRAIDNFDQAAKIYTYERAPFNWAQVRFNVASAYAAKATAYGEEDALKPAQLAYEDALRVYTRDRSTTEWSAATLGKVLMMAYQPDSQTDAKLAELRAQAIEAREVMISTGYIAHVPFADQVIGIIDKVTELGKE